MGLTTQQDNAITAANIADAVKQKIRKSADLFTAVSYLFKVQAELKQDDHQASFKNGSSKDQQSTRGNKDSARRNINQLILFLVITQLGKDFKGSSVNEFKTFLNKPPAQQKSAQQGRHGGTAEEKKNYQSTETLKSIPKTPKY